MRRRKQKGIILEISGRWYVRYWEAVAQDGRLIRKRKTHCLGPVTGRSKKTPADIEDECERYMSSVVNDNSIPAAHNMTFAAFVENETDAPLREIAQSGMREPRGVSAGAGSDVLFFDQKNVQSKTRCVGRDAAADDASADHQEFRRIPGEQ